MSGSPARPARVLQGALLGLVLVAPSGLLVVSAATAAPRVEVEPLTEACGVRLSFAGLPARTYTVHLDLVALDPVQPLALTPPGPREVDGGSPSVLDVTANGLAGAAASLSYRATVTLDGEPQPPVELLLPACADPVTATASPTATASSSPTASPGGTGTPTPSPSGTTAPGPSGTAGPGPAGTATASPSGTAGPDGSVTTSGTSTPTVTTAPAPTQAPVFGPRTVSAPTTGGSGVVALSGGVAAAPLGALPELAVPAPVVAPPTGGVAVAVAAAPPLAAALPVLPGRPGPIAAHPAPQAIAPELAAAPASVAPASVAQEGATDRAWTAGLPAALLVTGAAAGALGLRLRRRAHDS